MASQEPTNRRAPRKYEERIVGSAIASIASSRAKVSAIAGVPVRPNKNFRSRCSKRQASSHRSSPVGARGISADSLRSRASRPRRKIRVRHPDCPGPAPPPRSLRRVPMPASASIIFWSSVARNAGPSLNLAAIACAARQYLALRRHPVGGRDPQRLGGVDEIAEKHQAPTGGTARRRAGAGFAVAAVCAATIPPSERRPEARIFPRTSGKVPCTPSTAAGSHCYAVHRPRSPASVPCRIDWMQAPVTRVRGARGCLPCRARRASSMMS